MSETDSMVAAGGAVGRTHSENDKQYNFISIASVSFNISDQKIPIPDMIKRIGEIPSDQVKHDFKGDRAFVTIVTLGKEFGQDYTVCGIIYMHKENVANIWNFVLFKDPKVFQARASRATGALKFN